MAKKNCLAISSGRNKLGKVLPSWPRGEVAARYAINRIDTTCSCCGLLPGGARYKERGRGGHQSFSACLKFAIFGRETFSIENCFWVTTMKTQRQHAACDRQRQRFPSNFPLLRESLRLTGAKTKAKSWSCALRLRLRLEVVAVSRWPKKVCQVFDKDQVHLR